MKEIATIAIRVLFVMLLLMTGVSCERPTSPPAANTSPNTTIANIPKDGDTLFALVTLSWDGEDVDGYIAFYEYRYTTVHVIQGDSAYRDWDTTTSTSVVIAFESRDTLNYQVFAVRAVDNDGNADPTPAEKRFYTVQTIPPRTQILSPQSNAELFVIDQTTDWWQGIPLTFNARDLDGPVVQYGWAVDDTNWTWTTDTTVYIPPGRFASPLAGYHILRVTSLDNTNLIDPVGAAVTIRLIRPTLTRRILIIDETLEGNFPSGVQATDQSVDSFYAAIFGTNDAWDYPARGAPPRDTLGQYQLVVWHADDRPTTQPHALPSHTDLIEDYLNVGGKFIMSGWRILKSFAWTESFPISFPQGSFVYDYLHIITADETLIFGDCIGAAGVGGFSDIQVDSTKLAEAFPFNGKLGQVNLIPVRGGFTDIAYTYRNPDNSPYTQYRGKACGLRYYGTTFDAVVLGFPVFFISGDDAQTLALEILQSLGMN